ncbi:hypothetical protein CSB45_04120 [candidate division KSB3 bacterium]|uniref:DUF306 domain-containing protein n=1 Tax=candidate division KSB3 bacterium TaxID=2044937 RepID=A0A2G6E921_9BACT|nr:MAG: hypothetical protein CSB45_04120 [candidate division KSB3 bacterium]PIE30565.1 MAG: hypothetical protein CSA57_02705 [candidate division KSB3 bacterium]
MRKIVLLSVLLSCLVPFFPAHAFSPDALKNAVYHGIFDKPVSLHDGRYEGEPIVKDSPSRPIVSLVDALMAFGDLNDDGQDDAAVVLLKEFGETATLSYVAVMLNKEQVPVNFTTLFLGKQINIKSIAIDNEHVLIDLLEDGKIFRNVYQFGLRESASEERGPLSISSLKGVEWHLTRLDPVRDLVKGTEINVHFDDGKISGKSGCNRYSAALTAHGAGRLKVGPPVSTRKACPPAIMKQEQRFLADLQTVTAFSISNGKLLLKHQNGSLIFQARPVTPKNEGNSALKE